MDPAYDPPLRRRSASFSSSAAAAPPPQPRRQSTFSTGAPSFTAPPAYHDDTESSTNGSDDDGVGQIRPKLAKVAQDESDSDGEDPADEAMDAANQRPGRSSKGWEKPGTTHSSDMEQFLAQLYDLTHAIDALENDLDDVVALRKKITRISPAADVGGVSIKADLDSLAALTNETGKEILSLETWLTALYNRNKSIRALVKAGKADYTPEEIGEIKFQISSSKLDFADAMERIRDEAWKEQDRRQRIWIKMAQHIRQNEPDIPDSDVKGLLKAAELGAADGVANVDVTSYAGLWALHNPFTELAELTDGMRFLHDDLDREIVDQVVPRPGKSLRVSKTSSKKSSSKGKKSGYAPPPQPQPWHGSQLSYFSSALNNGNARKAAMNEKDFAYGYARQAQLERSNRRKKMIVALLIVIIIGLVLLVFFATLKVPTVADITSSSPLLGSSNSSDSWTPGGTSASVLGYPGASITNQGSWGVPPSSSPTATSSSQLSSSSLEPWSSSSQLSSSSSLPSSSSSGSSSSSTDPWGFSTSSSNGQFGSVTSASDSSGSASSTVWWTQPTSSATDATSPTSSPASIAGDTVSSAVQATTGFTSAAEAVVGSFSFRRREVTRWD